MFIFPAIDLYEGKAVRLYKGDYAKMTVYSENPIEVAHDFEKSGAKHLHIVDLEGARDGTTPNLETVCALKKGTSLFCEIGGGIRTMDIVDRYIGAGIDRVILGTAAVTNPAFATEAAKKYGEKIAVGADVKNGCIAIKGWLETSGAGLEAGAVHRGVHRPSQYVRDTRRCAGEAWLPADYCPGPCERRADGAADYAADYGHLPADLHHQPHQSYRRSGTAAGSPEKSTGAGA